MQKNQLKEAANEFAQAVARAEKVLGADHDATAILMVRLSELQQILKRPKEAEVLLTRAILILEKKLGKEHLEVGNALIKLGNAYFETQRYAKARDTYARSLSILRKKLPHDHLLVCLAVNQLGLAYGQLGQHDAAEKLHRENLQVREAALGKDHPHVLLSLRNVGGECFSQKKYDQAIVLFEKWLERNERGSGDKNPVLGLIDYWLGLCYKEKGDVHQAESYLTRSLELLKASEGGNDAYAMSAAGYLGLLFLDIARHDAVRAEKSADKLLGTCIERWGPIHPTTGHAQSALAQIYFDSKRYAEAEPLMKQAIRSHKKKYDPDDGHLVSAKLQLMALYEAMKRPQDVEPIALHLLKRFESMPERYSIRQLQTVAFRLWRSAVLLGRREEIVQRLRQTVNTLENRQEPNHPDVAKTLIIFSIVNSEAGQLDQAVKAAQRAVTIQRETLGKKHSEVANSLIYLGSFYGQLARYSDEVSVLREAMAILQKSPGENQISQSTVFTNLGFAYQRLSKYIEADACYRSALQLAEKNDLLDCMELTLCYWGRMFTELGQFDKGEALLRRAAKMAEERVERDPNTAWVLVFLAQNYVAAGRHKEAEKLYLQARPLFEKAYGATHSSVRVVLSGLGEVYMAMNRYDDAEWVLKQALLGAEEEKELNDRDLAITLGKAAELSVRQGHWQDAVQYFHKSRRINHRRLIENLPSLAPREQMIYLLLERQNLAFGLSLGLLYREHPKAVEAAAEWLLNAKGISAELLAEGVQLARSSNDPQLADILQELRSVREQIARIVVRPEYGGGFVDDLTRNKLERRAAALSRRLGEKIRTKLQPDSWVTLYEIRRKIPSHGVLIDVALFPVLDPKDFSWQPDHYVAWIIPAAGKGSVQVIDLGEATRIDEAVAESRKAILDWPLSLHATDLKKSVAAVRQKTAELATLLWKPLKSAVGKAELVLVSPDGGLWLFPWEALPVGSEKFLAEEKQFCYLVTSRQILDEPSEKPEASAVVFAMPNYDLNLAAKKSESNGGVFGEWIRSLFKDRNTTGLLAYMHFPPWPDEKENLPSLAALLQRYVDAEPSLYVGNDAQEKKFKQLHHPEVLIFSTHGYFLPDEAFDLLPLTAEERRVWTEFNWRRQQTQKEMHITILPDPLLRCGLALAGANRLHRAPDANDGILTGTEILGVDLHGTELVVLNACETGMVAVRLGEGTEGLRHAFHLAGARSVLSSLWPVLIRESREELRVFFDQLAAKQSKVKAWNEAQRTLIRRLREEKGAAHPGLWAGFTLTGDWR